MLIKNLRIKSLLLALISLNVGYTYATGVVNITADATAEEIAAAKQILATPSLASESAYQLEEITDDVEASDFVITKYLCNSETCELTEVQYNVVFEESFGDSTGDTSLYYQWAIDEYDNKILVDSSITDVDITCIIDENIDISTGSNFATSRLTRVTKGADVSTSFAGFFSSSSGGAILNDGYVVFSIYVETEIGDISGDFLSNSTWDSGGAIYNSLTIDDISGDFSNNSASDWGGAIYNSGTIDSITSNFVGNTAELAGGAIYNAKTGTIGDIIGDFIGNERSAIVNLGTIGKIKGNFINNLVSEALYNSGTIESIEGCFSGNIQGGITNEGEIGMIIADFIDTGCAIENYGSIEGLVGDFIANGTVDVKYNGIIYNEGEIGDITASFVGNVGYYRGAIYNKSDAKIGNIVADFIGNSSEASSGGAIENWGTIGNITGDFIGNSATSYGGSIRNSGEIGDITGDFINNQVISDKSYNYGGAIRNSGIIGNITGDFIGNSVSSSDSDSYTYGGAISNGYDSLITSITGDFIGNSSTYRGGAIYNDGGTISSITGNFTGNSVNSDSTYAKGGAIYNSRGTISFIALNEDMQFTGNYVSIDGVETSNAIYNNRFNSYYEAIINMDAYDASSIIVNDGISGAAYSTGQFININQNEGATSIVAFNNTVDYQTINVYNGSLNLGEYAGGIITLSSVDETTITVAASSAMLNNCTLNIATGGTVNTKADYVGSTSTITNKGILNISGGTLSTSIAGAGTINILGDLSVSSDSMTVAADSTLNNYATLTANLTVNEGADINAIITSDNLGKTIFEGSISGITSMDVSFDLSLNLNDIIGTSTTIYANESDGITLTLVDSDSFYGVNIVGNTIIVDAEININTDDCTATVTKDGDSTNIDVTTGSFEIAEGITQTLSSITTGEDATLVISGGTLVTDNDLALANDDATSGVKADSGVIESTATVELSEGTISVASGSTLEIKAELNLADDTQATFGSSDASLVLQKDITLGENSVLTLDGNISGSANIIGNGTATINYTGVFSPGNSPELVTYSDVTVNYMGGSILEMEIFGEAGAGVDGGHDKIVFYGCNVSFDGTIQLNIDDVASLMGEEQSKTITIDLFDFEGGTSIVSFDADLDLVYDSNGWFVIADTSNLLTTGEVTLSITAIPEPSTATLSLIALAGMLVRRRRKAA